MHLQNARNNAYVAERQLARVRLQRTPHMMHPPRRAISVHDCRGVVRVVELQAVLAAVIAPAAAHDVFPERGLRCDVVLQVADARKRVAEPGVRRVGKHESVERAYLVLSLNTGIAQGFWH